jgi:hypothetical protein
MTKFTSVLMVVMLAAGVALVASTTPSKADNGAPSGAHYNLNIIGVPKGKTATMTGNSGHRIFVPLEGKAKINLAEGSTFQVLDANGTDGNGASFQLPNPDVDGDGVTSYSVYVRALGQPGGSANMQTCYTDATGTWCAVDFDGGVDQINVGRTKGKSTFTNVTKDLLFVDYCTAFSDLNGDGVFTSDECTSVTQIPLFGEAAEYFWDYDNNGLKVAQLRFYEIPTTVSF